MNKLKTFMFAVGLLVVLGTAGSSDLGSIGVGRIVAQVCVGLLLIAISALIRSEKHENSRTKS